MTDAKRVRDNPFSDLRFRRTTAPDGRQTIVRRGAAAALFAAIGAVMAGCRYLPADTSYAGPVRPAEDLAAFVYERGPVVRSIEELESTPQYTIRRVHLDAAVDVVGDHDIVIDYYDVGAATPVPAILVLPILGGKNKVAKIIASFVARAGCAALIVHRQDGLKDIDELELMNPAFRQIVLDHMQAIDWIETRPELDAGRIGVFGVSAGAIKGALVSAIDDRIGATVLALVGGDVPYIFAYSQDRGLEKKRKKILAESGVSADELYRILDEEFIHDPLDYAHRIDAANTLLVLAAFDAVVPYQKGMALRAAIGNPETIVLPTGHYGAVLFLRYIEGAAVRFFEHRFGAADADPDTRASRSPDDKTLRRATGPVALRTGRGGMDATER